MLLIAAPAMVVLNTTSSYASGGQHGTKISASQVPKAVRKSFNTNFSSASQVEWEFTAQYYGGVTYTASFNMNGTKWEASFNTDGTLLSAAPKA